jgi:hypothetical protein
MDPLLANIDLNSNPYAGTEHDTNKSLRDFALERIMARRENRSQLAQIARVSKTIPTRMGCPEVPEKLRPVLGRAHCREYGDRLI